LRRIARRERRRLALARRRRGAEGLRRRRRREPFARRRRRRGSRRRAPAASAAARGGGGASSRSRRRAAREPRRRPAHARSARERAHAPARRGEAFRQEARARDGRQVKKISLIFSLLPLVLAAASPAFAQSAPQIQFTLEQDTVGVGDVVRLEMTVTSPDEMPTNPRIGATPGFAVRGEIESPTQTHISINGNRSDRYSLTVDWALQAQHVGAFSLGPPSVSVGSSRFTTQTVKIRVVPAGRAPRRAPRQPPPAPSPFRGFSPFDPWKTLIPGMDPFDQAQPTPSAPPTDPKLTVEPPRGAVYFLHATIDKPNAVVGEQVTFSVYEYLDVEATDVAIAEDARDAQVPDFVKHPLLREDQDAQLAGYASAGGKTWVVKLVRRWALFPLRTGDLDIGPMTET